ncbi:diguanylate cyclase, partial [Paraburkholderia sp. SIMBA_053]
SRITGYPANDVEGRPALPLLYCEDENQGGVQTPETCYVLWDIVQQHGYWQGEVFNKRRDGTLFSQWLTLNLIAPDSHDDGLCVAVFSDITHIKESQRQAEYLATHDSLTGLPNR